MQLKWPNQSSGSVYSSSNSFFLVFFQENAHWLSLMKIMSKMYIHNEVRTFSKLHQKSLFLLDLYTMGTYNVVVSMIRQHEFGRIEDFLWLKLLRSMNVIFLRKTLRLCGRIFWIRLMKVNSEKVWLSISNCRSNYKI